MNSTYFKMFCTPFHIKDQKISTLAIERLIAQQMGLFRILLIKNEKNFSLGVFGDENKFFIANDLILQKIKTLIPLLSPYVTTAFKVTLRKDTIADDRDTNIYGGPNAEEINKFQITDKIKSVMTLFDGNQEKFESAIKFFELGDKKDINAFINLENGIFQNVVSSKPINLFTIERDVEFIDSKELTEMSDGSSALIKQIEPIIDTHECDSIFESLDQMLSNRRKNKQIE